MTDAPIRKATIDPTKVGWGSDALSVVQEYLPSNYEAVEQDGEIVIFGRDSAGWTLDDYVIPRLASGMIYATEVK